MPPKKAHLTVSDLPAWQCSVMGFLPSLEMDMCQTDGTVACTSTHSSSDVGARVTANDDQNNHLPKTFRVCIDSATNGLRLLALASVQRDRRCIAPSVRNVLSRVGKMPLEMAQQVCR